jgi:hypothetical protein
MENTEKVLFEDDTPHWYIAMGDRWTGPLSASDVYERVTSQQITWAHFVWKPGQSEWKRLCDVRTFQAAVPALPGKKLQTEVKEVSRPGVKSPTKKAAPSVSQKAPVKAKKEERPWFLYYNDTQFGPFTVEEINRFLSIGKVTPRVHAWKGGMSNWVRLKELAEFQSSTGSKSSKAGELTKTNNRLELRTAPRRPMVARILLHNNQSVTEAMCRDISVGGMQVLTDEIPGVVGSKIRLNVSSGDIEPFVAEGEIVRLLEDQRGFSFRFSGLSDSAKKTIEKYIKT